MVFRPNCRLLKLHVRKGFIYVKIAIADEFLVHVLWIAKIMSEVENLRISNIIVKILQTFYKRNIILYFYVAFSIKIVLLNPFRTEYLEKKKTLLLAVGMHRSLLRGQSNFSYKALQYTQNYIELRSKQLGCIQFFFYKQKFKPPEKEIEKKEELNRSRAATHI